MIDRPLSFSEAKVAQGLGQTVRSPQKANFDGGQGLLVARVWRYRSDANMGKGLG